MLSQLETELLALWGSVLGSAVGLDDDLFEVGGQSLHLVRLTGAVQERYGVALPLVELFADDLTVRAMAASVAREVAAGSEGAVVMERPPA